MAVDLFTDDLDAVSNDELFVAISDFAELQPNEGWRHDYTREWTDSSIKNIAAFANTFGGLFIIGVEKGQTDAMCQVVGVECKSEYKTRVASSIAANISPVPSYRIFECHKPGETDRKFCVVRVAEGRTVYLVTKKDVRPVYVRNENQAVPADAAQLRRLIDREREAPVLSARMADRVSSLRDAMVIRTGYRDKRSNQWESSATDQSHNFLKLVAVPTESLSLELDRSYEAKVLNLIDELYPRVPETVRGSVAKSAENRSAEFYEYVWYHTNIDYEARWRITDAGALGHATQMENGADARKLWSVVDLAIYLILFLRLSARWSEAIGYFGDRRLHVQLQVPELSLQTGPEGYYTVSVNLAQHTRFAPSIRKDALVLAPFPRRAAVAEVSLPYFTAEEKVDRTVTSVLNQLLRSLGHAVFPDNLLSSVTGMI